MPFASNVHGIYKVPKLYFNNYVKYFKLLPTYKKKGEAINHLKMKHRLLYLKTQSEDAVKTFHLSY